MDTQKDKATQRPWRYEAETKTIRSVPANYWLATMTSFDGAVDNEANAEFIVKAVNDYDNLKKELRVASATITDLAIKNDALLDACKKALHVHIDYVRESGDDSLEANEYQEMLSNVISQATK